MPHQEPGPPGFYLYSLMILPSFVSSFVSNPRLWVGIRNIYDNYLNVYDNYLQVLLLCKLFYELLNNFWRLLFYLRLQIELILQLMMVLQIELILQLRMVFLMLTGLALMLSGESSQNHPNFQIIITSPKLTPKTKTKYQI